MKKVLIWLVAGAVLLGVGLLAVGYQATVYLMPTPAVISSGNLNPFDLNPERERRNEISIFFATNRIPALETENRIYTIFPGSKMRMGVANMRIGDRELPWEKIFRLSTSKDAGRRPAIILEDLNELAKFPVDGSPVTEPGGTLNYAELINRALEKSPDKKITIYVHGANTGVYRAAAQAAQYHHFTGQNSIVMAYFWPSAENLFAYGTDTRHAKKSAPAFAQLLTFLAENTDAEYFNILAYSAGAQILSPALDILGKTVKGDKRKALRLGKMYFAAADIGIDTFTEHLASYVDMPQATTLAMNLSDSVLALAARRAGISRAGRPDLSDLTPEKTGWLQETSIGPQLALIKVSSDTVKDMRARSHDFWFAHPWVSSDVLTQFLFHKRPHERGLQPQQSEEEVHYWIFPADYPERIVEIVGQGRLRYRAAQ